MQLKSSLQIKYWFVAFAGALFAILVWKVIGLQFRYAAAVSGVILMLSLGMMAASFIIDFFVYFLVFNTPFSRFGKWLFVHPEYVAAKGISLGIAEVLILSSYLVWFSRIIISRQESFPKLQRIDYFVFLLICSQFISLIGAPNKVLGGFDIIYTIKHFLIYFFIAHKIKRYHLKWIVVMILFSIMLESSLAFYERLTGNVGIGITKGNVASSEFATQHLVPGIEHLLRAAGTTTEPHTLGLYFCLILPIPLVFLAMKSIKPTIKFILFCILAVGIAGLIMTFSRSGWLSFAIATSFSLVVIALLWKQGRIIPVIITLVFMLSLFYPKAYEHLFVRLMEAPTEIMESRYEMNKTALGIWRQHFLFGYGAANYMYAIDDPDVKVYDTGELPVHNAFLLVASETGLLGLISFYSIIFIAMFRCAKVLMCKDYFIRGLALAFLTGYIGYLLDGLTGPMFKSPVPYAQLWIYIGLSMSFERLLREQALIPAITHQT